MRALRVSLQQAISLRLTFCGNAAADATRLRVPPRVWKPLRADPREDMTSEYTRLRDGHEWNKEAGPFLGTCRTWRSGTPPSCVTLVVVLGCLTFLGILLAIAVLERPAQPGLNATLPAEPAAAAAAQCR